MNKNDHNQTPEPSHDAISAEIRAIESGLDEIGRALRSKPDAGFESRIALNAVRESEGSTVLRITGRPDVHVPTGRGRLVARLAAALLITGAGIGLAWTWLSGTRPAITDDPSGMQMASATDAEIAEIADAWDVLDDSELAGWVDDVSSRVTMVSDSSSGAWISSWLDEDSM